MQPASPDEVPVPDIASLKGKKPGLGFVAKRAGAKGLTGGVLTKEADPVKSAEKKAATENIQKELAAFKVAKPSLKILKNAQAAAALLKAHKMLKIAEQAALSRARS